MQFRSIIFGVIGVLVVLAFGSVLLDSQGQRSVKVDNEALDEAISDYNKNEAEALSAAQEAVPSIPLPRRRKAKASTEQESETHTGTHASYEGRPAPRLQEDVFKPKADFETQLNDANKLYDKADYEGAREAAIAVLTENPDNVRMKRIVVSSSCIMGDEEIAVEHHRTLPPRDQRQMARRCKRYGIEFEEEE